MSLILKLWSPHDGLTHIDKEEFLKAVFKVSNRSCLGKKGDGVRPGYAQHYALKDANWILVAFKGESMSRRGSVLSDPAGFILANRTKDNIYLGVICSDPGVGGSLLKFFNDYSNESKITSSLDAVPSVLGLYSKDDFGYEFRKSCSPGAEIINADSIKGKRPQENIEDDPLFAPFIEKLQQHEFNVNKTGRCKNKNLKIKQIFGEQCYNYGFTMFRCANSKAKRYASPKSPKHIKSPKSPLSPRSPKSPKSTKSLRKLRRSSRFRSRSRSRTRSP